MNSSFQKRVDAIKRSDVYKYNVTNHTDWELTMVFFHLSLNPFFCSPWEAGSRRNMGSRGLDRTRTMVRHFQGKPMSRGLPLLTGLPLGQRTIVLVVAPWSCAPRLPLSEHLFLARRRMSLSKLNLLGSQHICFTLLPAILSDTGAIAEASA
jgi:hypothetical protein